MNTLNEFAGDNIYIRHAIDDHPDGKHFDMHVHDACEIFYFISGNAEYLVEGSSYPLQSGSLLIMSPKEAHCTKILSSERYERYAINFPLSIFDSFDPKRQLMKAFTERPLGKGNLFFLEGLQDTFHQMSEKKSDNYARLLLMKIKLLALVDKINNQYLHRSDDLDVTSQTLQERIVTYVNLHLFEELSISTLAQHFFLSPSQFSRVFKQATGAPPWEYITAKRLVAAKEKIATGDAAQHAAESCGFGDYSAFYRAYVKRFGCSPNKKES